MKAGIPFLTLGVLLLVVNVACNGSDPQPDQATADPAPSAQKEAPEAPQPVPSSSNKPAPTKNASATMETVLYLPGSGKPVQTKQAELELLKTKVLPLLSEADSQMRMMLNPNHIQSIKQGHHLEIVFKQPQDISITKLGRSNLSISRILIGFEGRLGWQEGAECRIVFGDPDYKEFNLVINTQPSITRKDLIALVEGL